jgi:integrase
MKKKQYNLNGKEPVRLRTKRLKNGGHSLYLDIYWNRRRSYEFLKMYLRGSADELALVENKNTLEIARQIKYKRILALQLGHYGVSNGLPRPRFADFFAEMTALKQRFRSNADNWNGALKHLMIFLDGANPTINEIDDLWLLEFKDYLSEPSRLTGKPRLAPNTAHSYFNKIRSALTVAYHRKMIDRNPASIVKAIPAEGTLREFLTVEEVKKLVDTPCEEPLLKDAFLFSVLTGLRWSDVFHLKWEQVKGNETEGWYLQFQQRKTKDYLVLPVTAQAKELLGTVRDQYEQVFAGLKYSAQTSNVLSRWSLLAGIAKKITFHSARHTHATLLISKGVDIYTVSKLLGHRRVKSTELYAHMTDALKVEAINKLPVFNTPNRVS